MLHQAVKKKQGATIFAYKVNDPQRYVIIEFDKAGKAISIEEKPKRPKSRYAVPGLYFYDSQVVDIASSLRPSVRGELEITDINKHYLERGELHVEIMRRGLAWLDTGTFESLLEASTFIQTIQNRQGIKIACLEEIAYRSGYINAAKVHAAAAMMKNSNYSQYLLDLIDPSQFTDL